jgi:DNA-binding LacI/PurR family transcriptional regulator
MIEDPQEPMAPSPGYGVPARVRIAHDLRERILSSDLPPGTLLPSENELAAYYGASRNQARAALRQLHEEGLASRSQGKRTAVANRLGAKLPPLPVSGSTMLALALPEYPSQYVRDITEGFLRCATQRGHHILSLHMALAKKDEVAFLKGMKAAVHLAGAALWLRHPAPDEGQILHEVCSSGLPIVLIDRGIEGMEADFNLATTDNEQVGFDMTMRLVDKGRKRIAFAEDGSRMTSEEQRFRGYRRALDEAGLQFAPAYRLRPSQPSDADVRPMVAQVMCLKNRPTAFVCLHEFVASSVLSELRELGFAVPDDIDVVALSDHEPGMLPEGVGIGRQQGRLIGEAAAELLIARIQSPARPVESRRIPAILRSTKVLAPVADIGEE